MTVKERQKMERALDARGRYVHKEPDGSSGCVESNCVTVSWRLKDIVDLL